MKRIPKFVFAVSILLLASQALAQPFDPFKPSDPVAVRKHCLAVAGNLGGLYRVEVIWDIERVVKPNCEMMVGLPETQARVYHALTLPTRDTVAQIAGTINSEMVFKSDNGKKKWYKPWTWFSNSAKYVVHGDLGVFEVKQFSTPKQ